MDRREGTVQILTRWRPWLTNAEPFLVLSYGTGWQDLIVETVDAMVEAVKPDGRFRIRRIEEEFGGLRVYVFGARPGATARRGGALPRPL